MNKKGAEAGINVIVFLIIGILVLVLMVYFVYNGFNTTARGATDKGREFLGDLNSLSLSQIRSSIQRDPSGFLNTLLLNCRGGNTEACNQYIAICERGENPQGSVNQLNQNELRILKEKCTQENVGEAKQGLLSKSESEAQRLYEQYLKQDTPQPVKESLLRELLDIGRTTTRPNRFYLSGIH